MVTLPTITKKQETIINLLYRYRFLSRLHLQLMLNHKNPQKINLWLKDLTEKDYIKRIYSIKFGDNTKPAMYYTGINTIRYTKQKSELHKDRIQKLYHEKYRTPLFQEHCKAVADFVCNLQSLARSEGKAAETATRVDYISDREDELTILLQTLSPDLYYRCDVTGIAQACFVEVIDEHVPVRVLKGKILRYIQAMQEIDLEIFPEGRFPSVAFLLPSVKKLRSLQRTITTVRIELDDEELNASMRFNLGLISDILTKSIVDSIWIKA